MPRDVESDSVRRVYRSLAEIPFDDAAVDRRKRDKIRDRRVLVHLMHGLPEKAEFEHGTVIFYEARVRGAAARRKRRLAASDITDGTDNQLGEWARLCQE